MKKLFMLIAMAITLAQFNAIAHGAENGTAAAGMPLRSQDGHSLGTIYKVAEDGSAKVIVEGRLVTLPVATLHAEGGTVTTTLSKSEVYRLK
jgi:hypothetical protein